YNNTLIWVLLPRTLPSPLFPYTTLFRSVWTRCGIGPTKVLAKMATDNFAKKRPDGIFELNSKNIEKELWQLPVHQMFMVASRMRSEEHTSELQSRSDLVCRLLLEKKKNG